MTLKSVVRNASILSLALAAFLLIPAVASAGVCSQPAHAWYGPSSTVSYGGSIYLAAIAYPNTYVDFVFKDVNTKVIVDIVTIGPARSNCVVDHLYFNVFLPRGDYAVRAEYIDDNGLYQDVRIGTLTVQ